MRQLMLGVFSLGFWAGIVFFPGLPVQAYSYGPACQWIHLEGQVISPTDTEATDLKIGPPYFLSVTYQLPGMRNPSTLLTNYRLDRPDFVFFFAGFHEKIKDVHLVPPMFFFAKEIVFRYFVRSVGGQWRSPTYKTTWTPTPVPIVDTPATRAKTYRCHTKVELEPIELRRRRQVGWTHSN